MRSPGARSPEMHVPSGLVCPQRHLVGHWEAQEAQWALCGLRQWGSLGSSGPWLCASAAHALVTCLKPLGTPNWEGGRKRQKTLWEETGAVLLTSPWRCFRMKGADGNGRML